MKTIFTGSARRDCIADAEISEITCWLRRWNFVAEGRSIVMAFSNEDIVSELVDLEGFGATLNWHGHEVVFYPDVPENTFLIIVSDPQGYPETAVVWESGISEEEESRRRHASIRIADERKAHGEGPTVSELMVYTMIAECVLPDPE